MQWREGDLGFYCNRTLLHRASASTQRRESHGEPELRLMHRISIKGGGTPPFYMAPPPRHGHVHAE